MEWYLVLIIIIGLLLAFFASGMYVAFAFLAVDIIGLLWFVGGEKGLRLLTTSMYDSVAFFSLTPLPLYLMMAEILFQSGAVSIGLDALENLIGKVRARLNILALVTGTLFGAISGVGMGTTAMLGRSLLPEMTRRGYDRKLGIGCLMGAGVLDAIIPPSTLAVLVGSFANVSVAKMLIGGIVPGLIMSTLFIAYILIVVRLNPKLAPPVVAREVSLREKGMSLVRIVPFGIIIFLVLGTMQMGVATPSEAAALGIIGSVIILPFYKINPFRAVKNSLMPTFRTTAMLLLIFAGAKAFSQVLSIAGATGGLAKWVTQADVSPMVLFFLIQLIVFFLGMFIEQSSIMMICIPVFLPVVAALQFDPLWFWLVFLLNIVIGAITPPFGLILFTAKSVSPQTPMLEIYLGAIPFVLLSIVVMALMTFFPWICTWLPNAMSGG